MIRSLIQGFHGWCDMVLDSLNSDFLREANQKFLDGDGINNGELMSLITFYIEMEAGLRFLGPEFRLIWKEVSRRLSDLEDFRRSREHHR